MFWHNLLPRTHMSPSSSAMVAPPQQECAQSSNLLLTTPCQGNIQHISQDHMQVASHPHYRSLPRWQLAMLASEGALLEGPHWYNPIPPGLGFLYIFQLHSQQLIYIINSTDPPVNPCQGVQQLCNTASTVWPSINTHISTLSQPTVMFDLFLQFTMWFPHAPVFTYSI